jgi:hypothetical protein
VFLGISDPRQGELPQIAQANRALTLLFGGAQRRNQQRKQQSDNRNHHQQLDQREGFSFAHGSPFSF